MKRSECNCGCHEKGGIHCFPCCTPDTFEEICEDLPKRMSAEDLEWFKNHDKEDLISLHHSLGGFIRNRYRFWEDYWEPELREGIDYSPNHPDARSQKIIETVYSKLNEKGAA